MNFRPMSIGAFIWFVSATASLATNSFCAVTNETKDGFVSLRSGPAAKFVEVGRVLRSDLLIVDTGQCRDNFGPMECDPSGKWLFVEAVITLRGSSREKGWVNARLIRQIACDD